MDLLALNQRAWTTESENGITLKDIFEDPSILKMIWAVAQDGVSLWANHGILLKGVIDLQYMLLVGSDDMPQYKPGLNTGIIKAANLTTAELDEFQSDKSLGGFWHKFKYRPLAKQ